MTVNFKEVEAKWQKRWEENKVFAVDVNTMEDKFYTLVMFPYPSGDKLHMGHWYQYGLMDTWARYQRLKGKNLFFPMGFDAFGLPAENFAIKSGIHPDISTTKNVNYMMEQFKRMGVSYNFEYKVDTSKADYYKWTQWLFIQLYKNGLAYKKSAPVNWCGSCQTVLANEQVKDGACERCDSEVIQKNMEQWFFKITDYSDKLLDNLDSLDWPHKTKAMQKNWIGRSEGAQICFSVCDSDLSFEVFTTRPDTLYGVTYVTLAPEHPLVRQITTEDNKDAVEEYIAQASRQTELDRLSTSKEKTGVFSGAYAVNPVNNEKVPIWIGDYVLGSYGTGAVMAVPAHDERDFAFAKQYKLPIRTVIVENGKSKDDVLEAAFTGVGTIVNSQHFDGMKSDAMIPAIIDELEEKKYGRRMINFRLRDWLVSRQRYWGAPIPVVYCPTCGTVPVPEEQLPVKLPEDVDFKPSGVSPLATSESFVNTTCPICSAPAKREVDTLDTFVCSSWYYLRFPNAGNDAQPFEPEITNKMLPVDKYVGGPEHACMHLLYARFINMVMKDLGHVNFEEPFTSLTHQGMILGPDGQKMSKSKGNSVSPDDYVDQFGADILRLYLCFGFNYVEGGPWDESGIRSVNRFVDRVSRLFTDHIDLLKGKRPEATELSAGDKKLLFAYHSTVKSITQDTERFQFNTSIARLMELYNSVNEYLRETGESCRNKAVLHEIMENYMILLSPFMPHFAEEWWERTAHKGFVCKTEWPEWDEQYLVLDEITMAVMVNGKLRGEICVASDAQENVVKEVAMADEKVSRHLEGMQIVKHIFVKGKLINLIVKPA
jgi:leucyl-tRNA synthetase